MGPNCHYKLYRLTCKHFDTLVAVFTQNSQFRRSAGSIAQENNGKVLKKENRDYYLVNTIYGPASGFVIRNFDAKPFFELKRYMKQIGGYTEEELLP